MIFNIINLSLFITVFFIMFLLFMNIIDIVLLSVWLSMDAFAVCITDGLVYKNLNLKNKFIIILVFGIFHFIMPLLWFYTWNYLIHFISKFDHWIALILLLYVWWEMIFDFAKDVKQRKKEEKNIMKLKDFTSKTLFFQSIAVSIDAIAVWLSFSIIDFNIWNASILIALVCMLFCSLWFFIWKKFWIFFKHWSLLFWWLILVWIWVKIFIEHSLY